MMTASKLLAITFCIEYLETTSSSVNWHIWRCWI